MRTTLLLAVAGLCLQTPIAHADTAINNNPLQSGAIVGGAAAPYASMFGIAGEWSPQGIVVADSGFRPYPNGFSFANYGSDQRINQILFGQPDVLDANSAPITAVTMDSKTMRQTFGNGVCLPGQTLVKNGQCNLTQSANVVEQLVAGWGAAGHCFGLSNVSAAFFNGQIDGSSLHTGAVNSLTTLNDDAQRTILRAVAAQYFSATGAPAGTMTQAITTLRSQLTLGKAPITILMYGLPGGHALTPFAVLDKGNGLFDIAVYDSNIPNQMRAIHVDTVNNSWSYQSSANNVLLPQFWDTKNTQKPATMWFGSVSNALKVQACSFCQYRTDTTLVSFSPVKTVNMGVYDDIVFLGADGKPLSPDLYQVIPSSNPVGLDYVTGPVYQVNIGVPFAVALSGASVRELQPFTVTVVAKGSTQSVRMDALTLGSEGVVAVGATSRTVNVRAQAFQRVHVTQTTEEQLASFKFSGTEETGGKNGGMFMRVIENKKQVIFRDNRGLTSTWSVHLTSASGKTKSAYQSAIVNAPAKSQLVATYVGWKGSAGKPKLWLDLGTNGTLDQQIPLKLVTK